MAILIEKQELECDRIWAIQGGPFDPLVPVAAPAMIEEMGPSLIERSVADRPWTAHSNIPVEACLNGKGVLDHGGVGQDVSTRLASGEGRA